GDELRHEREHDPKVQELMTYRGPALLWIGEGPEDEPQVRSTDRDRERREGDGERDRARHVRRVRRDTEARAMQALAQEQWPGEREGDHGDGQRRVEVEPPVRRAARRAHPGSL